jgi:hypothetical protein
LCFDAREPAATDLADLGDPLGLGDGLGANLVDRDGKRFRGGSGVVVAAADGNRIIHGRCSLRVAVNTLLERRHAGARLAVGAQVDERNLPQRRLADDVDRAGVLLAVDGHLLALLDELELFDAGADRRLPGEAVFARRDHFPRGFGVAGNHARSDQLAAFDTNCVAVADTGRGIVTEPDRPRLRRDRQSG